MSKSSIHSGRAFDAGLAALAAVSAGFVVFAMPEPVFSGLIEATRLPDLVAAAQPPLGETARLAVTGAAAFVTFVAVWALMAALGRVPAPRVPKAEPEAEAPRLRRADAHPDAPARRPLLARDLGEPLELDQVAEAPAEEPPFAEAELRPLPGFLVPQTEEPEELEPEPVAETEPEVADYEPAPEFEPEPMPLAALTARLPEPEEEADQPLSQLVNRIEFGLARKRQALPAAEQPPAEEPAMEAEKVGHRLRSAINDLQKIASSGT
ncbi:MAG: hypothetical protein QOG72_2393 [Sphingomonadales bacterium]|jgi:hypothetical protein|nr:hypothetical protein [Sphingomonadales bacterium]